LIVAKIKNTLEKLRQQFNNVFLTGMLKANPLAMFVFYHTCELKSILFVKIFNLQEDFV